jgi:hydrogenase maturation protein HypF
VITQTHRWVLTGRVQGVGFRPFVYRLAHAYRLRGRVQNRMGEVEILVQGSPHGLAGFGRDLIERAPPLARPRVRLHERARHETLAGFTIVDSATDGHVRIHVPPDYFTCDACLAEMLDPADRRFRYPFINCTQCGPRYTLIRAMPYDRRNTTMAGFPLCEACRREYEDPLDRRFHAEPVACSVCGPRLVFRQSGDHAATADTPALEACVAALRAGRIVAVKGVGGYHLMCDARNDVAVACLRERKPRPHKPLAVMYPVEGEETPRALGRDLSAGEEVADLLLDPMRPIVLVDARCDGSLSPLIAPGLEEVGVMLPYSPLHHLLLKEFGGPLVATSGNISGEPVLTGNREAETRLGHVAQGFLHHDRPIARPADDPVFRRIAGVARPIRLGRGCAPHEIDLPFDLPHAVLGAGAHMKNTLTLAWTNRAVISPHIGDMDTPRSLVVFRQVVEDLQALYGVRAEAVVCDAHPGYGPTRWADGTGLPLHRVFHHHAHASALVAEAGVGGPWLVFTWDGLGVGEDGSLWGGEALLGAPGAWRRVASIRPFHLPGGEKAGREPWRSAAALCWETGREWPALPAGAGLLKAAWERRLNCPRTSAVGRLFDAAAAFTGLCQTASYEGQGPMYLEAACRGDAARDVPCLPLQRDDAGLWLTDWEPLVPWLMDAGVPVAARACGFHASLAEALLVQARAVREEAGVSKVGLCGGVFQNRVLAERAIKGLQQAGFTVFLPERIPVNDAAISFGQVMEYAAQIDAGTGGHGNPSPAK